MESIWYPCYPWHLNENAKFDEKDASIPVCAVDGNGKPFLVAGLSDALRSNAALLIGINLVPMRRVNEMAEKLVYLMQRGHEFKIGHTRNLKRRLAMLSTGSAIKLKVIHTVFTPNNVALEKYLKAQFASVRLRGEWYALNDLAVHRIRAIDHWPVEESDSFNIQVPPIAQPVKKPRMIQQCEISFEYHSEKPLNHSVKAFASESDKAVQELFRRYGLEQHDMTRILAAYKPQISRSYAHYVWQGQKPPSANVILAIHEAHPEIPATELLQLAEDTRRLA